MTVPLRFVVPMPPPLSNASGGSRNWRTVHRAKVAYQQTLDVLQATGRLPAPPKRAHESASIASVMYLGNRMDTDNALIRHKWVLDWLQSRGYVKNDRDLDWVGFPKQEVLRGQEYRIELTVIPL